MSCDLADVLRDLSREGKLAGYEVTERFYEIGSPEGLADFSRYVGGVSVTDAEGKRVFLAIREPSMVLTAELPGLGNVQHWKLPSAGAHGTCRCLNDVRPTIWPLYEEFKPQPPPIVRLSDIRSA